ncbi:MAG: Na(+)/H(+) antiporter subunit D, partial [Candidatus Thiodiazotropha sp. (ex Codakia orbicularis)]|nr:Na(+)/H(+) antiporter subunit D [Candidatus Thiodiazotropha sp. (ex Codakia orbicularis)]
MSELSPFLIYFLASLLVLASPAMIRNALLLATPVLAALHLFFNIEPGMTASYTVLEFEMVYLRADKLSLLFAYLFTLASFISTVFALHVKDVRQQVAGLIYAGSAL